MALGLTAALDRLAAVITACDSSASWERLEQRITGLGDAKLTSGGIDHKFWVGAQLGRRQPAAIAGQYLTSTCNVTVELGRFWGGGSALGRDYYALAKELEGEAAIVEQHLQLPTNWARSTTGIVLLNQETPSVLVAPTDERPVMIWTISLVLLVRQEKVAVAV